MEYVMYVLVGFGFFLENVRRDPYDMGVALGASIVWPISVGVFLVKTRDN